MSPIAARTSLPDFEPDFASPSEWAEMYRVAGLQVVPAQTPSESPGNWKRPALAKWQSLQFELAPDSIFASWYGDGGAHVHRQNMGLLTGQCSGGVFVVDLDFHSKPQALEWWQGVLAEHNYDGELETVRQTTGGGGAQLFFRAPQSWKPPTIKTSIGVDIRGQGGFAMLPPSLHQSGTPYCWDNGCEPWTVEIAEAPQWLCEEIDRLDKEHGGGSRLGPSERTASTPNATDAFGFTIDGREEKMRNMVWARLCELYKEAPVQLTTQVASEELADLFATYLRTTKTRLKGVDNAAGLEREGRGETAFREHWRRALEKWGPEMAKPPRHSVDTQPADAPHEDSTGAHGRAFLSFGRFKMSRTGLFLQKGGDESDAKPTWISGPFETLGLARNPDGNDWGLLLRWRDPDGREHMQHIPKSALYGDFGALCGSLANAGLRISRSQQKELVNYLLESNTERRVTIVGRTGWHEIGGNAAFVLPGESIAADEHETVFLHGVGSMPYLQRGSLDEWQREVSALASGHALPVLAISAALAGPLLHMASQEGGGIHFVGQSSKGKTTLLQAAASVWGPPNYVRAWRATANGLEGAAALTSDTVLVLDEFGQVDSREAGAVLYSLSNGSGKQRAGRDGGLREAKSWRLLIISSGEVTVESKLSEERGRKPRAGQLVRMLDIPVDRGFGFGAFDSGGPEHDAGKLAQAFKLAANQVCGSAGPEFVRRLLKSGVSGQDLREDIIRFMADTVPNGADGQIERAAQRLGLVASAGEIATELGLTLWRKGEATEAAAWAFKQWVGQRGGLSAGEERQAIEQVRLVIEQHGESRFQPLGLTEERPVLNRLGWRKGSGPLREWWVQPESWKAEICNGLDPTFVARTLTKVGFLERDRDGFQCVRRVNGQTMRVYVLKGSYLGAPEDSSPADGP